jgi:lysophospholipase L1-like esterase
MPTTSPIMPGPITYLALGDSTGSGVGASEAGGGYVARLFKRIVTHRPGSKLINLCVSGATTLDVLRNQLGEGVRTNPQLVTLGIGINDIGHGLSLERFSKKYDEILARLRNNTRATIVVTNIPISPARLRFQPRYELNTTSALSNSTRDSQRLPRLMV